MYRYQLSVIIVSGTLSVNGALAEQTMGNVVFQPAFDPATGLHLEVQNYTKLPKQLATIDILIGGDEMVATCHLLVPGTTLGPAIRSTVRIADVSTVNSCLPAHAPTRRRAWLARIDNSASTSAQPSTERSMRVIPHFAELEHIEPQQLRFQLGN